MVEGHLLKDMTILFRTVDIRIKNAVKPQWRVYLFSEKKDSFCKSHCYFCHNQ